jgi:hypothetical protein
MAMTDTTWWANAGAWLAQPSNQQALLTTATAATLLGMSTQRRNKGKRGKGGPPAAGTNAGWFWPNNNPAMVDAGGNPYPPSTTSLFPMIAIGTALIVGVLIVSKVAAR